MRACVLTSSRVVPTGALVDVVDVVDLTLRGDCLLPAVGQGGEVGEGGGLVALGGTQGLGLVEGGCAHRLARVLPCGPVVPVTETHRPFM